MNNEAEKMLRMVSITLRALYTTQILTAALWIIATVVATSQFISANGNDHTAVLVMVALVVLMGVQVVCVRRLRPIRDEWSRKVKAGV